MLRLGQQIDGGPAGVVVAIRDNQHLRRASDRIDADTAVNLALGLGDIGVTRPNDLIDFGHRRRAIGQGGHRLGATDPINLINAGDLGGGQDQRVDTAVRRRRDHHPAADPGDARRDGVHQQRTRIGGAAAGHIEPRRRDGPPALTEADAVIVYIVQVLR